MNYYRRHIGQEKKGVVSHNDDWLMTYADMITLLLCFFVVFLSLSVPKKNSEEQRKVEAAQESARPKSIMEGNLPFHGINVSQFRTVDIEEEAPPTPAPAPKIELSKIETPPQPTPAPQALSQVAPVTKAPGPKGDRITTLDMNSATFFDVGSSTLSEGGRQVLLGVTETLKSEQYKDYQVTVEGHTDDAPISTPQFPSNWELSTARASAVVHYFLDQGIPAQKLRAAGYADTFPKVPNRDANGIAIPENQAANRRVVIKLEKIVKDVE